MNKIDKISEFINTKLTFFDKFDDIIPEIIKKLVDKFLDDKYDKYNKEDKEDKEKKEQYKRLSLARKSYGRDINW